MEAGLPGFGGLPPGNEDNEVSGCFSPQKPYFLLSNEGILLTLQEKRHINTQLKGLPPAIDRQQTLQSLEHFLL